MQTISTILPLVIGLVLLISPFALVLGVVLLAKRSGETDKKKKGGLLWISILSIAGPALLIFVLVTIWGLTSLLNSI